MKISILFRVIYLKGRMHIIQQDSFPSTNMSKTVFRTSLLPYEMWHHVSDIQVQLPISLGSSLIMEAAGSPRMEILMHQTT
jgi:hypothetical protein